MPFPNGTSWPRRMCTCRHGLIYIATSVLMLAAIDRYAPASPLLQSESPQTASASGKAEDGHAEFWQGELQPFLEMYCYDCHAGTGAEADIDFTSYGDSVDLAAERPRWNQVRGLIEIGAMPPADYGPLPTRPEREKIADAIDRLINTVDCKIVNDPGRVTMRRLNNVEYDNSVRDLLGIDFSVTERIGFPSDGVGNGFDNQGDVLTLSPLQLEKYMQAAQLITSEIIVHDPEAYRQQRGDVPSLYARDSKSTRFLFADGKYKLQSRLWFEQDGSEKMPVAVLVDGEEIARWEVTSKHETLSLEHEFTAGEHEIGLHFVEDPGSDRKEYRRRIDVDFIGVQGPENGNPAMPKTHTTLFVTEPSDDKTVDQAAREVLEPVIRKAFRREPEGIEVERVVNLVKMAVDQGGTFKEGVAYGLQSILVSPNFLFRIEDDASFANDETETLGDYEMATRLAYFLWASLPDESLLAAADSGTLSQPEVLNSHVSRMLADPKSRALVTRFFGQFLGLGSLKETEPDPSQFPLWNDRLRAAVLRETELFCQEIVTKDLPLRTLLQGDFTFVNPRLAELYGLEFDGQDPKELYEQGPGLRGRRSESNRELEYLNEDQWVRVSLPENRRGVLTHSSILTLTSNPTSTSPVKRGKWILESILGDPPPPAPPNVPSFEDSKKGNEGLSLRQQLEIHRENPSCASCHNVMDPLGLGFENFDAIGQYREMDGKHPVDAAGKLADGREFNGSTELVGLLATEEEAIYRHFAEKLLTYALGRGLEPYDNCAVDEIMAYAESNDYRLSSFIEAIVTSDPFSKRRSLQIALTTDKNPQEG